MIVVKHVDSIFGSLLPIRLSTFKLVCMWYWFLYCCLYWKEKDNSKDLFGWNYLRRFCLKKSGSQEENQASFSGCSHSFVGRREQKDN